MASVDAEYEQLYGKRTPVRKDKRPASEKLVVRSMDGQEWHVDAYPEWDALHNAPKKLVRCVGCGVEDYNTTMWPHNPSKGSVCVACCQKIHDNNHDTLRTIAHEVSLLGIKESAQQEVDEICTVLNDPEIVEIQKGVLEDLKKEMNQLNELSNGWASYALDYHHPRWKAIREKVTTAGTIAIAMGCFVIAGGLGFGWLVLKLGVALALPGLLVGWGMPYALESYWGRKCGKIHQIYTTKLNQLPSGAGIHSHRIERMVT